MINNNIKQAIKILSRKNGRDFEWTINDLLKTALGDLVKPEGTQTITKYDFSPDFHKWISNLPFDTKIFGSKAFADFNDNFKNYAWMHPKTFSTWINQYAISKDIRVMRGNSIDGRWFLLIKP